MENFKKHPGVGIGVILLKNNKVLLGKRHEDPEKADSLLHGEGTWTLPGGKLDFKEDIPDCAYREVYEETGLRALKVKRHNKSDKYKYNRLLKDRPGFIGQTYSLYSAEVGKGKAKFDKTEHSGLKWKSFDKAIKMLKYPNQKMCLRIVNSSLV